MSHSTRLLLLRLCAFVLDHGSSCKQLFMVGGVVVALKDVLTDLVLVGQLARLRLLLGRRGDDDDRAGHLIP